VKNRPAVCLLIALAIPLAVGCLGCKKTTVGPTGASTEASDGTEQILAEIRKVQQATGSDLRALTEEVKRQQELAAEKSGDPPVARDLAVLRLALSEAKQAVEAKDAAVTEAALSRMERACQAMAAELPAGLVAQHVDRALTVVRQQEAAGSTEYMVASLSLLAASEAAVNGRPPALVPDVLNELDAAKGSLDGGNAAEARKSLATVLEKATGHPAMVVMARVRLALSGAREALMRQAWPVVAAELAEIEGRAKELAATVTPEPKPDAAAAKKQPAKAPEGTAAPQQAPTQGAASATGAAEQAPVQQPAQAAPVAPQTAPPQPATGEAGAAKGGLGRLFGR
jgi:hypothetical protein